MSLDNSLVRINSYSYIGLSLGVTTVGTFSASAGYGCYFDYFIMDSGSGANAARVGVVMAVWDNSFNSTYTDSSTPDLNGPTNDFLWRVTVNTNNVVQLLSVISGGVWDTKVSVRIIS
jgi:hypothetical protein